MIVTEFFFFSLLKCIPNAWNACMPAWREQKKKKENSPHFTSRLQCLMHSFFVDIFNAFDCIIRIDFISLHVIRFIFSVVWLNGRSNGRTDGWSVRCIRDAHFNFVNALHCFYFERIHSNHSLHLCFCSISKFLWKRPHYIKIIDRWERKKIRSIHWHQHFRQ